MTNTLRIPSYTEFALPASIVSKADISRMVSEMEQLDNSLSTHTIRTTIGIEEQTNLNLSPQLTEFLNKNKIRFATDRDREDLIKQLRLLKDTAPVIHMTFAVDADKESLQKLCEWVRSSVHPQAVISDGLQPALVAGVYMRMPSRVHDMSLRGILKSSHNLLIKDLEALRVSR